MIKGMRFLLAGTTSLVLCAQAHAAGIQVGTADAPATVAPADSAQTTDSTEIVVTAQKREQRLIDVPLAVTALDSKALTTQGLNRLSDYFDRVPGLQYSGQRVSNLSLRGITTGGVGAATVAILVDDVQFGGTTAAGQPTIPDFDASLTQRIEVLRGPQGTLYGASSLGGIIKYVLQQPDTREVSGRVEVSGSSVAHGDEGYAARGTVNVPVTDWMAVMVSGFKREDPPYLDNFATKRKDTNSRDVWGYRGAVLIRPTSNLTITGSALRQKQKALNSDLAINSGGVPICVACTTGGTAATRATAVTTFEPVYGDLTINTLDSPARSRYDLYSGRAVLDLGKISLTSISAWSKTQDIVNSDVSAVFTFLPAVYSPGATVQIGNANRTTKFSQELRASATFGDFDVLAGGFYTVEHATTDQTIFVRGGSNGVDVTPIATSGPSTYREKAVFGDVTWHVTDTLEVQVGGRYAGNKQRNNQLATVDVRATRFFGASSVTQARSNDDVFTWLVSPTYRFSRDLLAYARVASGYRPGGTNGIATGVGPFDPDRVVNYELGFKGRVIPDLMTIDAAVFQIDWKDIQLQGTNASNLAFTTNGGKARSRGIELATNVTPWRGMSIDGNMALTDAELAADLPTIGTGGLAGRDGDRLPATARFAGSITAAQRFDLTDRLQGSFSANYTHVGDRRAGFNTNSPAATRPRIRIPAYDTLNLTAGMTYDRDWQLTLALRNVTDRRGVTFAQNRNGVNIPTALYIVPRTITLAIARNF